MIGPLHSRTSSEFECAFRTASLQPRQRLAAPTFGEDAIHADKQLLIRHTFWPSGLRFTGEIDAWNLDPVVGTLAANLPDGHIHFELSQLTFCDVGGIRALVSVAEKIKSPHCLVFHGAVPKLRTALNMVGWGKVPQLVLCDCGGQE